MRAGAFPISLGVDPLSHVELVVYRDVQARHMAGHLLARVRRMNEIGGRPDVAGAAAVMLVRLALADRPELRASLSGGAL